eukprot:4002214-Amphidinium_carterae.1
MSPKLPFPPQNVSSKPACILGSCGVDSYVAKFWCSERRTTFRGVSETEYSVKFCGLIILMVLSGMSTWTADTQNRKHQPRPIVLLSSHNFQAQAHKFRLHTLALTTRDPLEKAAKE